jgi:hypothetical protein
MRVKRGRSLKAAISLPSMSRLSIRCGILDILQLPRPFIGTALLILLFTPFDLHLLCRVEHDSCNMFVHNIDRLCGLVVRVLGYRFRGPGSIPGATRFFWEVVGLEQGPLSLVSTIEELLERISRGSGLENRKYGCRDQSRRPRGILFPQKLALISPTSGGRSVGIVRSRTQATEFSFLFLIYSCCWW